MNLKLLPDGIALDIFTILQEKQKADIMVLSVNLTTEEYKRLKSDLEIPQSYTLGTVFGFPLTVEGRSPLEPNKIQVPQLQMPGGNGGGGTRH